MTFTNLEKLCVSSQKCLKQRRQAPPPLPRAKSKVFSCRKVTWLRLLFVIDHFRVPKALTFKMRLGAQLFLWKWVLFAWEWKMISISKAEHLPSFWNRGPGQLGNGLLNMPIQQVEWKNVPFIVRLKRLFPTAQDQCYSALLGYSV